jgi:L-serine/L-threonine ammonia-lyase
MSENLWSYTPLRESSALSDAAGCGSYPISVLSATDIYLGRIFLKLETFQPSGSFKFRGTSHLMRSAIKAGSNEKVHYYCSSGGNAGIACATAARSMGYSATICVPMTTSSLLVKKLKMLGADVHQTGASWADADRYLRVNLLAKDPTGFYIPPFDHPVIWEGASSLCEEIYEQMEAEGGFDGVVCSVGGGSLLTGIMTAIGRHSTSDSEAPKVLAVETRGADSLNSSLREGKHIALPKITSIATSLGIVRVAERAFELGQRSNVRSIVLSDAEAAMGAVRFAEDENIMVEVSCGVALAAVYNGSLREAMGEMSDEEWSKKKFVVAVCGGSDVSSSLLKSYREKYSAEATSMIPKHGPVKACLGGSFDNGLELNVCSGKDESIYTSMPCEVTC